MLRLMIKVFSRILYQSARLIPRNQKTWLFGSWFGERFADNSKYMFIHVINNCHDISPFWVTKNKILVEEMSKHYPVLYAYSLKGIYYQLTSGFVFFSCGASDFVASLLGGAEKINLWHGVPLKKIMFDDNYGEHNKIKTNPFRYYAFKLMNDQRETVICTSDVMHDIYVSAFNTNKVACLGQPRNDVLFDVSNRSAVDDFKQQINISWAQHVYVYMPTHRKEGKSKIPVEKLFDLEMLQKHLETVNAVLLIKKHYYHVNEYINVSQYSNIIDITSMSCDTQILMMSADVLITDYSSCFIDYLLLNRKIIFYGYDKYNYLTSDRDMYFEYEQVIPEKMIDNWHSLFSEIIKGPVLSESELIKYNNSRRIFYNDDVIENASKRIEIYVRNAMV